MREQPNQVNQPPPTDMGVLIEQYPGVPPPSPASLSLRPAIKQAEPVENEHPNPNRLMWHSLIIGIIVMILSLITKSDPERNSERLLEVFPFPIDGLIADFGIVVTICAAAYGIIAGAISVAIYYRSHRPVTTLIFGLLGLLLNLVVVYFFVDALVFHHHWFWCAPNALVC